MLIAIVLNLVLLAVLAWIWFGRRPSVERFAATNGIVVDDVSLPRVRSALRRTYTGRVVGSLLGALVLGLAALVIGPGAAIGGATIGLVAGTMLGIAVAEHRPRPEPSAVREASLTARTVRGYAPARAGWWIAASAVACVGASAFVAVSAPAGLGPYGPALLLALATLLIIPLGRSLERRIVEAPRDTTQPTVDDALRRAAVRAVHHSVLGVLLCGVAAASVGGLLTQRTLAITSNHTTVFRAPPGSTSISVDTGLRQTYGRNAPVRVSWTEADGSQHQTGWLRLAGSPVSGTSQATAAGLVFWLMMLLSVVAALVQWSRATNAWRRGPPSATVTAPTPAGAAGQVA
jgi:hypothetical protein